MGTRRWHEIKKLSFFKIRHVSFKLFQFLRAKSNFTWEIMRFQKKNYLNTTNGSKLMQHYRNHAPSGIVSLFGSGGGSILDRIIFFWHFWYVQTLIPKKCIEKIFNQICPLWWSGFLVGSISKIIFRYRYSVLPSLGNLRGLIFFTRKKRSRHITLYMVEKILDRAI